MTVRASTEDLFDFLAKHCYHHFAITGGGTYDAYYEMEKKIKEALDSERLYYRELILKAVETLIRFQPYVGFGKIEQSDGKWHDIRDEVDELLTQLKKELER